MGYRKLLNKLKYTGNPIQEKQTLKLMDKILNKNVNKVKF